MTHTATPWRVSVTTCFGAANADGTYGATIGQAHTSEVSYADAVDNAARIVACVNACAGIDLAKLNGLGPGGVALAIASAEAHVRSLQDRTVHLTAALGEAREDRDALSGQLQQTQAVSHMRRDALEALATERDREASVARELRRDLDGTVRELGIRNAELAGTEAGTLKLRAERDALLAALEAVLPYAITRGEDLEEAKAAGNEDPEFPGADKCTAACESALKLLAGKQPLPPAGVELVLTREQAQSLATALDFDLDDLSTIGIDVEDDECYGHVKEVRALLKGFGL